MLELLDKQTQELICHSEDLYNGFVGLVIENDEQLENAAKELINLKTREKCLIDAQKTLKSPFDKKIQEIRDFFKKPLDYLESSKVLLSGAMTNYRIQQAFIRKEQERKAREEAEKQEKELKDRLEKERQEAEKKGDYDKATEIAYKKDICIVQPVIENKAPIKLEGLTTKKNGKYRVIDFKLLPDEYKIENSSLLGRIARSTNQPEIPGVEFYYDEIFVQTPRK